MYKYFLSALIFAISVFPLSTKSVYAAEQFAGNYNITYDVNNQGVTEVTEKITLKNLTERFYATEFTLSINASDITGVSAYDKNGPLKYEVEKSGSISKIKVFFNQQISGKDKQYEWTLNYKSKDFAQSLGKVWQVAIPKISNIAPSDNVLLSLTVPVGFGDPTTITPEPNKQSESAGKITYQFEKNQIVNKGILANFGKNQQFQFSLIFEPQNKGLLPELVDIVLPSSSEYQTVLINSIKPAPENVTQDIDGNFVGWFKLDPKQSKTINVQGLVQINDKKQRTSFLNEKQYSFFTKEHQYWEKDNQIIIAKVQELLKEKNLTTNHEKAYVLYNFVTSNISYNPDRFSRNDLTRLGGLTTLNNPDQALSYEFSDLFVTLARAANIPARLVLGYAYSTNDTIRPSSYLNRTHIWAQYYDRVLGWVMVDPTWDVTSGGVDYFSKFDLNHFALAVLGDDSSLPVPASAVDIRLSDADFVEKKDLKLSIDSENHIFSGFSAKMKVRLQNTGNAATDAQKLSFSTSKLKFILTKKNGEKINNGLFNTKNFTNTQILDVSSIPPFGNQTYELALKTSSVFDSYQDIFEAKTEKESISRALVVQPFVAYKAFSIIVFAIFIFLGVLYAAVLLTHYKISSIAKLKSEKPKKRRRKKRKKKK